MAQPLISIHQDKASMFWAASRHVISEAGRAIPSGGIFRLALSGGETPRSLYEILAGSEIDWPSVRIFLVDERFVKEENPESNLNMIRKALISRINIPARNVHTIPTNLSGPRESAEAYREVLSKATGVEPWPGFDLVILGIGDDGHTASLFPGGQELESEDLVVSTRAPPSYSTTERVSLSLRAINASRDVVFLATGEKKRAAVRSVLGGDPGLPASRVRPVGEVRWYVTRDVLG